MSDKGMVNCSLCDAQLVTWTDKFGEVHLQHTPKIGEQADVIFIPTHTKELAEQELWWLEEIHGLREETPDK